MPRFQYRVIDLMAVNPKVDPGDDEWPGSIEAGLNMVGQHGWLLVGIVNTRLFLARIIPEDKNSG